MNNLARAIDREQPTIAAVLSQIPEEPDIEKLVELADVAELRIDKFENQKPQKLKKKLGVLCGKLPLLLTVRLASEGGNWKQDNKHRVDYIEDLLPHFDGVDFESRSEHFNRVIETAHYYGKIVIGSYHDLKGTPSLDKMKEIVQRELTAGADICKVITTAQSADDNLAVLQLIADFPQTRVVSFAMGPLGFASRVLCPLVGGDFTYASIEKGRESAPGQITVADLRKLYEMMAR